MKLTRKASDIGRGKSAILNRVQESKRLRNGHEEPARWIEWPLSKVVLETLEVEEFKFHAMFSHVNMIF